MILILSQAIVLLANSSAIVQVTDPMVDDDSDITMEQLDSVNTDLKEINARLKESAELDNNSNVDNRSATTLEDLETTSTDLKEINTRLKKSAIVEDNPLVEDRLGTRLDDLETINSSLKEHNTRIKESTEPDDNPVAEDSSGTSMEDLETVNTDLKEINARVKKSAELDYNPYSDGRSETTLQDLEKVNTDLKAINARVKASIEPGNNSDTESESVVEKENDSTDDSPNKLTDLIPDLNDKSPDATVPVNDIARLKKPAVTTDAVSNISEKPEQEPGNKQQDKIITKDSKTVRDVKGPVIVTMQPVDIDNDLVPAETAEEEKFTSTHNFDFVKYDAKGNVVEDGNEVWNCVSDSNTGLMWEVKSDADTMRKPGNLYSWYDPQSNLLPGKPDGGHCKGNIDCDTNAYISAMNKLNYCGHNDWRLPTREEMMGLVSYEGNIDNVKINASYFPETLPSWYWTASSNESHPEFAWYVLFKNGLSLSDLKENPKHIRLVRSESSS